MDYARAKAALVRRELPGQRSTPKPDIPTETMRPEKFREFPQVVKQILNRLTLRLPEPKCAADVGVYSENFERAIQFTRNCGFALKGPCWRSGNLIDEKGSCIGSILGAAGIYDSSRSAGQCLKWSHYLAPYAEDAFGCQVWPTVGQLWKEDRKVFAPTWADVRRWARFGIQMQDFQGRQGLNFHAWLTLETGEIIEPSLFSSLAAVNPEHFGKLNGGMTWGRDPGMWGRHRYFPMVAGCEYIEQVSARSTLPLLASDLDDLYSVTTAIVVGTI